MRQEDIINFFGETDTRNKRVPFGIRASDRTRHMYVIGKTGMGKSTLLENMSIQDIRNGEGFAFIDPHGKTAEFLLDYIPQERIKDVIYFAPFDLDYPISFNVMEDVGHERRHLVANGLMSAFKKIWVDAWSARMEYILNNILLSLLEYPDSTLIGVNRMLVDKEYRQKVVDNITDPSVKAFWTDEFAKYGERYMQEAGAAIQNKIGQFISNPLVRNIIGQPKSTFDIRKIMDEKKILIINLSKGRVGESNANLLGSMLITKIYLAAMSRADTSPAMLKNLPNFYLYVDEFQSFANESFADILSEARKYKLNLTIAHQYIEQMSEEVRAAVFGNVGSMIVFRVGALDAEVLEKEFFPTFTKEDLVNLGFVQVYLKLMIDGVTSQPFSASTLPPFEKPLISFKENIIEYTRDTYANPRSTVEEAIKKWHEPVGRGERRNLEGGEKMKRIIPAPKRNQEEDLRKVITESYLKHTEEQNKEDEQKKPSVAESIREIQKIPSQSQKNNSNNQKNTQKNSKAPTEENVQALRAALASLMQNQPLPTAPAAPNQQIQQAPRIEVKPTVIPVNVTVNVETHSNTQSSQTINHSEIRQSIKEQIAASREEDNKKAKKFVENAGFKTPIQQKNKNHSSDTQEKDTAQNTTEKTSQTNSQSEQSQNTRRKAPQEVPEHVLKKVLEME